MSLYDFQSFHNLSEIKGFCRMRTKMINPLLDRRQQNIPEYPGLFDSTAGSLRSGRAPRQRPAGGAALAAPGTPGALPPHRRPPAPGQKARRRAAAAAVASPPPSTDAAEHPPPGSPSGRTGPRLRSRRPGLTSAPPFWPLTGRGK